MALLIPQNCRVGLRAPWRRLSLFSLIALVTYLLLTGNFKEDLPHTRGIPAWHTLFLGVSNFLSVAVAAIR